MSSNQGDIIEGFLCPICKTDLKSQEQLTVHFESIHNDQDVLRSLKDIFGKAKKKILNLDEKDWKETFDRTLKFVPEENIDYHEIQTIGCIRNHSDYYKAVRSAKQEKYAAETNKLLIRLDKLVANMPTDQSLRKAYEQEIVPWLDGSSVTLCPGCTKQFNIARRQHHCRLCGAILCNNCSQFFDLNIARCMIDPSLNINKLQSNTDLSKNGLRLCEHCYNLIELRKQLQDSRNSKTILVTGYEQMRSLMEQTLPAIAMYSKMCTSLKEGEMTYHLSDMSILKTKIAKYAEGIDSLSKQIISLQIAPPGSQTTQLQKAIRQAAAYFVKEEIINLPPVPSEAEILEIRQINRANAERRIELERRRLENSLVKKQYGDESSTSRGTSQEGWTVVQKESFLEKDEEDPLVEQMNRIREYIKQAREEMRFEEVAILERNLKELKQEYSRKSLNA